MPDDRLRRGDLFAPLLFEARFGSSVRRAHALEGTDEPHDAPAQPRAARVHRRAIRADPAI